MRHTINKIVMGIMMFETTPNANKLSSVALPKSVRGRFGATRSKMFKEANEL
jgi:hypothetical protein